MTISSSLAAGVSGLSANSQKLASISDNIANSSTYGYKRTMTDFHSMVIGSGTDIGYTAGGVRATTSRLIDERGQLQTSGNATDIAIKGRGFLPVADSSAVDAGGATQLSLVTTGSFRPDEDGILTSSTGLVLMGWPADANGTFPAVPRDSADALEPINIFHNQYSANPTTEMELSANLPSDDVIAAASGQPHDLTLEYFGNLGQSESLTVTFTPTVPAAGDPPSNEWVLSVEDSASDPALVAEYTLEFNAGPTNGGTLAAVTPSALAGNAYDPLTGKVIVPVGGGIDIEIEIGELGDTAGITQLDSSFAPAIRSKNGSTVGNLLGVEIDPKGVMVAVYDSGFTRQIFKVPVVDVPNPNGLTAGDSQTYTVSLDSGPLFLWDGGSGPVGETIGNAREASTTDVAFELTQLIQTQRAYSSNAKIIQTVDEMLQETTNLKR